MAVTNIEITQDNKVGNVDALATHSQLIFITEVTYTGSAPDEVEVQVIDEDSNVLGSFNAVPLEDITLTRRTYMFKADSIIKGYMDSFDDLLIPNESLTHDEAIQKIFKIKFIAETLDIDIDFTAVHAVRQYGQTEAIQDIVNNEDDTYYAAEGMPVYVYVWNDSGSNEITIDKPEVSDTALDYDDAVFEDYDGKWLKI